MQKLLPGVFDAGGLVTPPPPKYIYRIAHDRSGIHKGYSIVIHLSQTDLDDLCMDAAVAVCVGGPGTYYY